jgi:hypothetical protein
MKARGIMGLIDLWNDQSHSFFQLMWLSGYSLRGRLSGFGGGDEKWEEKKIGGGGREGGGLP